MVQIRNSISGYLEDQRHFRSAPSFAPSGQSTQMIIGATPDTDYQIINTTENLYQKYRLKRVYYSAYVPVNHDARLPALNLSPPMKREHRLYQADWLLRFYRFEAKELLDETHPFFDLEFDPKINWAFHHMDQFPWKSIRVDYEELLRIPGIGPTSAQRIVRQRARRPSPMIPSEKWGLCSRGRSTLSPAAENSMAIFIFTKTISKTNCDVWRTQSPIPSCPSSKEA